MDRGFDLKDIPNDFTEQVIGDLAFWPVETQIYSSTGCKRVSQKVDQVLYEQEL